MENVSMQTIYAEARAKAKRDYNAYKAKGESGHLSSLDDLLKDEEITSTVDIGLQEISLKKIKGTNSNFRRMAFSKNFLPLEEVKTEFAGKWMALCRAHIDEGIRDPIKVYEYLNYYYVVEGNKRASVLKYYEASAITARIQRLIPKYNSEDPTIRLYYKFLDFHKLTGLNQLWLSHEQEYNELAKLLVDYQPDLSFYDDKYKHFYHFVYMPFRRIFKEKGGDALDMTTGDAFVLYARIYDIPQELEVEKTMELMPNLIKELASKDLSESMALQTDSEDLERSSLMNPFGIMSNRQMKIAFIYAKSLASSAWSRSHEMGRMAVEEHFGSNVETKSFENIHEESALDNLIQELVDQGYNTIFTTAPVHRKSTLSAALLHPNVKFFNCSGNRPYVHMSSYYGRSYESRFLTGLIAGAMTQSNVIGYTANEASADNISCINAFAMGARMVNPKAVVKVVYTGMWNSPEENAVHIQHLIERGADLIASKNTILDRGETSDSGITSMLCTVDQGQLKDFIAAPIWRWEVFYTKIITSLLNGSYGRIVRANRERQLLNFWWGLETGGIDVYLNEAIIPRETLKLVKLMKQLIISEQFQIFQGPIHNNRSVLVLEQDQLMASEEIIGMDFYVDAVEIIEK